MIPEFFIIFKQIGGHILRGSSMGKVGVRDALWHISPMPLACSTIFWNRVATMTVHPTFWTFPKFVFIRKHKLVATHSVGFTEGHITVFANHTFQFGIVGIMTTLFVLTPSAPSPAHPVSMFILRHEALPGSLLHSSRVFSYKDSYILGKASIYHPQYTIP